MPKTQAEMIREALLANARMDTDIAWLRAEQIHQRSRRDALEAELAALRRELADVRAEQALVRDWRKRADTWTQRWWALAAALVLAAAVALLRKPS